MMADDGEQLGLATAVTIAWLSNPHSRAGADDVSAMLGSVLSAIRGLGEPTPEAKATAKTPSLAERTPVVTRRKSLASPDYIISMIDGTKHRSLKRHLRNHGLTPEEYRKRFDLKPDYPMVAPAYSEARSAAAKQHQFGRKSTIGSVPPLAEEAVPEPTAEPAPELQDHAAPEPAIEAAPKPAATPKRRRLGISGAKQAAKSHLGTGDGEAQSAPTEE